MKLRKNEKKKTKTKNSHFMRLSSTLFIVSLWAFANLDMDRQLGSETVRFIHMKLNINFDFFGFDNMQYIGNVGFINERKREIKEVREFVFVCKVMFTLNAFS